MCPKGHSGQILCLRKSEQENLALRQSRTPHLLSFAEPRTRLRPLYRRQPFQVSLCSTARRVNMGDKWKVRDVRAAERQRGAAD